MKEGNMRQEQEAVSGEPKTLTLTFQEAVELLGREYRAALVFLPDSPDQRGDAWSTLSIDEEGYAVEDFAPTWEETMSAALGVRVVARDEAAELRAGFDKMVYRLDDALKEAAELRQAITEFITARREHFYYTVNESGLDVAEYNRTASRYEAALETLRRIGEP